MTPGSIRPAAVLLAILLCSLAVGPGTGLAIGSVAAPPQSPPGASAFAAVLTPESSSVEPSHSALPSAPTLTTTPANGTAAAPDAGAERNTFRIGPLVWGAVALASLAAVAIGRGRNAA